MSIQTISLTSGLEIIGEIEMESEDSLTIKNTVHFLYGNHGEERYTLQPFPWPLHADPVKSVTIDKSSIIVRTELREESKQAYEQFIMQFIYRPAMDNHSNT